MISITNMITTIRPLLGFILGVVIYSFFIFKFYRFLAKKDLFKLDLKQYKKFKDAASKKGMAILFYIFEHIFLLPILIFFWFALLSMFLSFLATNQPIQNIMMVSISLVAAVRITSYYSEDLSRDLAKMLPFALLGVFLTEVKLFSLGASFAFLKNFATISDTLIYYLLFVIILEFVLRALHWVYHFLTD